MERLTFNAGRRGVLRVVGGRTAAQPHAPARRQPSRLSRLTTRAGSLRERYDWDYVWMLAFTALLFFRPQDQVPPLAVLHLSELTAIAGLAAMTVRRMAAGQPIVKVTPEVVAVIALGGVILFTIPFSIWPGGSLRVFSDIYVKVILIFALMVSTLTSPRRIRQMTWLMIVASGYIAGRGVFDYLRGVNLVEGNRLRGAVGGMFENPNDLALNLVTFLAPALFVVLQDRKPTRRAMALGAAVLMLAAIVCTKSRGGFLGLVAMFAVVGYYMLKIKPHVIFAAVLALALATPMLPQSFWDRMDSITNADADPTGSRAARIRLINQALGAFADNPITGIGAGQFVNYAGPDVVEKNRVTHNVWLQVAAELGIFGLFVFAYMVLRGFGACRTALRALRGSKKANRAKTSVTSPPGSRRAAPAPAPPPFTDEERRTLDINAKGMLAALTGWFVCACFASVAFNWTFYYVLALAVAGREITLSRRDAEATPDSAEPAAVPRLVAARR
jgi:O-antigen ligase